PPAKDDDFKIKANAPVKLKAGEKKEAVLLLTYGKDFKGKITLELKADKGLNAKAAKTELNPADSSVKIDVSADKDEPAGKAEIHITATGGGKTNKTHIKVEVETGTVPPTTKDDDFKLKPGKIGQLKAGDKKVVAVNVDTDKDFKGKITLELKAGKGLKV